MYGSQRTLKEVPDTLSLPGLGFKNLAEVRPVAQDLHNASEDYRNYCLPAACRVRSDKRWLPLSWAMCLSCSYLGGQAYPRPRRGDSPLDTGILTAFPQSRPATASLPLGTVRKQLRHTAKSTALSQVRVEKGRVCSYVR